MPVIQITNVYKGDVLRIVQNCTPEGFSVRTLQEISEDELISRVADADYILASGRVKISRAVLEKAKNLKMIQRTGVGLDSLDLDAIKEAGIPLYVNKGVNSQSVAEHTILLMLACLRRLTLIDHNSKNGIWNSKEQAIDTRELSGKTVGIIGMGNIGQRVAEILRAFHAKVLYFSIPRESRETEDSLNIEYVPMDQLLSQSDIITLHCPMTPDTKGVINEQTISLMKDGVTIVNTARGGLIDEKALYEAIESGKVGFAGLDVHAGEPYNPEDKLILSRRVIATPHIGGVTYDAFEKMISDAMRNIVLFEKGELEAIQPFRMI